MKTEQALQTYLRRKVIDLGASFDKVESRTRRGFPDVMVAFKGRVIFCELKSPAGTGRLSELQKRCIKSLREQGLNVYVIDSKEKADSLIEMLAAWAD